MKDISGNEVTVKEFFQRWKEGMKNITPLQQAYLSLGGNVLVLIGVIIGLCSTWHTKWLFIILLGSLILVLVQFIGTIQRMITLRELLVAVENCKEVEENVQ